MLQESYHMVSTLWDLCFGFQVATYPRWPGGELEGYENTFFHLH